VLSRNCRSHARKDNFLTGLRRRHVTFVESNLSYGILVRYIGNLSCQLVEVCGWVTFARAAPKKEDTTSNTHSSAYGLIASWFILGCPMTLFRRQANRHQHCQLPEAGMTEKKKAPPPPDTLAQHQSVRARPSKMTPSPGRGSLSSCFVLCRLFFHVV
jgi:hypothetical protein